MLKSVLFLLLVGFASYKSFQTVSSISHQAYWASLPKRESLLKAALTRNPIAPSVSLKRQLAEILWQEKDYKQAETLLVEACSLTKSGKATGYNPEFVQATLELSSLYLDEGAFSKAIASYACLLEYDQAWLGDARVELVRDLNNLGVAWYLTGQAAEDSEQRKTDFQKAHQFYERAKMAAQHLPESPEIFWRLERILSNQELVSRDLEDRPQEPFDHHKSPNNNII